MATYTALVYSALVFDKWKLADARWTPYAPLVRPGDAWWKSRLMLVLLAGSSVTVLVLLLPKLLLLLHRLPLLRKLRAPGAIAGCLTLALGFLIMCAPAWLTSEPDIGYWGYYIGYGCFLGIIEGIWRNPLRPTFLLDDRLTPEAHVELLKFEDQKWWHSLQILWGVLVAIVVGGTINYVVKTPEEKKLTELAQPRILHAFVRAFSAVPGVGLIAGNLVLRTNCIQKELQKALIRKGQEEGQSMLGRASTEAQTTQRHRRD